jgi:hypothetical protein
MIAASMIPAGRVAKTYGGPDLMERGIREVNADWDNFRNWPVSSDIAPQANVGVHRKSGSRCRMRQTTRMTHDVTSPP